MNYKTLIFLCVSLLSVSLLAVSCSSDDSEVERMMREEMEMTKIRLSGEFVADTHPTSGTATVSEDGSELILENFKSDNGPVLKLYLSTSPESTDYLDLGELKGLEGDFTYDLPEDVDFTQYKFVVVWCVEFSVGFGHAELKVF